MTGFNPFGLSEEQVGNGWRLLEEGEQLQPGDGFFHPDSKQWIAFECRPDLFRKERLWGSGQETVHDWPWRRKHEDHLSLASGGLGWSTKLTISSGKGSVTIDMETGKVTLEGTTLDEASLAFWNAVESSFHVRTSDSTSGAPLQQRVVD